MIQKRWGTEKMGKSQIKADDTGYIFSLFGSMFGSTDFTYAEF